MSIVDTTENSMDQSNSTATLPTASTSVQKIRKLNLKKSDVSEEIIEKAIRISNEAMDAHVVEKDIATFIKKKIESEIGGTWQCIAGRNFGCSITHNSKNVLFFQLDQTNFLIFQSFN